MSRSSRRCALNSSNDSAAARPPTFDTVTVTEGAWQVAVVVVVVGVVAAVAAVVVVAAVAAAAAAAAAAAVVVVDWPPLRLDCVIWVPANKPSTGQQQESG